MSIAPLSTQTLTPASEDALLRLDRHADSISQAVTNAYFEAHPECCKPGQEHRIRQICHEDMRHHLAFLRNALSIGVAEVFSQYVLWLKNVLWNRGLDTSHTRDALVFVQQEMNNLLEAGDRDLAVQIIQQGLDEEAVATKDSATPPASLILLETPEFTRSLISGQRQQANQIVDRVMAQSGRLTDVSVGLVQPAMYEVGRLWQLNQLSVAQEHLATAVSQNLLARAYAQAEFKDPLERKALFTCVEGNHHALGLRTVSDAFEVEGWDVDFLGDSTPTDSLIQMLDETGPDMVGLSIGLQDQVLTLKHTIDRIHAEMGANSPAIIIGGLPFNMQPSLALAVSADEWFPNAEAATKDART